MSFLKRLTSLLSQPGFNVIATVNAGSKYEDGKFIGTNILNEASQGAITVEQSYPTNKISKILLNVIFEKVLQKTLTQVR